MTQDEIKAAFGDALAGTSSPQSPFVTASRILPLASNFIRELGCERKDDVIASAMWAYDNFVRPLDIPGVPNVVESIVDERVGEVLEIALKRLADRICGDQ